MASVGSFERTQDLLFQTSKPMSIAIGPLFHKDISKGSKNKIAIAE